jgi:hypothetical protein
MTRFAISLRPVSLSCTFIAIVLSSPTLGGEPRQPESVDPIVGEDIVVTGHRAPDDDLGDVRSIAIAGTEPLARFETEVCPRVLGLPQDYANVVETRIRSITEAVGSRTAAAGCEPNLTLIVAENGAETLASLRKKRPLAFAAMSNAELLRLRRSHGPVWNWYSVDPKRADGGPVEHMSMISFDGGPPTPISPDAYIVSNASMSRLTAPVRLDLTLSFIILDKNSLDGLTLAQVADFSAMLGLSMINYERAASLRQPSILQLFAKGKPAESAVEAVTSFDVAYLKGLYAGEAGLTSDRRTARIAASLAKPAEDQGLSAYPTPASLGGGFGQTRATARSGRQGEVVR